MSTGLSGRAQQSQGRAVKAGRRPPGGGALTARSLVANTLKMKKPVRASCCALPLVLSSLRSVPVVFARRMRASLLISALGVGEASAARWRSGCPDERGCGRSFLVGCSAGLAATGLRGAGRRSSIGGRAARSAGGSGRCFEGDLANLAKGVVAAARELASDGDESDVGVEPLTKSLVVGIVG